MVLGTRFWVEVGGGTSVAGLGLWGLGHLPYCQPERGLGRVEGFWAIACLGFRGGGGGGVEDLLLKVGSWGVDCPP